MATAVLTRTHSAVRRSPLELWHLLSLDAPCVAAVWTAFLAHQLRLDLSFAVPLALGLAVWLLYAADRIHDATAGEIAEERHRFHLVHRRGFMAGGAAVSLLLALLVAHLPYALRQGWLLLSAPLFLYLAVVHLLRLRRFSKEPLVALFFAAAVTMPLLASQARSGKTIFLTALAFGCLCWLNCTAIARWEQTLCATDICTAWLGRHFALGAALTVCLAMPLIALGHTAAVGIAAMAAAACLLLLDRRGRHLARTTRRGLADAALLTPIVVWPVLNLFKLR